MCPFFSFLNYAFLLALFLLFQLILPWWMIVVYLSIIATFLFVPSLRAWQDRYTPGWDWTERKD
jgi:hypothetical protein